MTSSNYLASYFKDLFATKLPKQDLGYSPPEVDRIWLLVYYNKIPIYPIFYLVKGDYSYRLASHAAPVPVFLQGPELNPHALGLPVTDAWPQSNALFGIASAALSFSNGRLQGACAITWASMSTLIDHVYEQFSWSHH